MYDTLVKAWAHWGDYLENLFTKERSDVLDLLSQQLSSASFCYSVTVCVCLERDADCLLIVQLMPLRPKTCHSASRSSDGAEGLCLQCLL